MVHLAVTLDYASLRLRYPVSVDGTYSSPLDGSAWVLCGLCLELRERPPPQPSGS